MGLSFIRLLFRTKYVWKRKRVQLMRKEGGRIKEGLTPYNFPILMTAQWIYTSSEALEQFRTLVCMSCSPPTYHFMVSSPKLLFTSNFLKYDHDRDLIPLKRITIKLWAPEILGTLDFSKASPLLAEEHVLCLPFHISSLQQY